MMWRVLLGVLLSIGFGASSTLAQLPGCRPSKPLVLMLDDLILPLLLVDPLCGDPDAEVDPRDDSDADRLPDSWERVWFGNLTTVSGAPGALTDYDGDGRTDLEEFRFGLDPTADDFAVATHTDGLTYDPRGRLTAVTTQGKSVTFGYDAVGNLLTVTPSPP